MKTYLANHNGVRLELSQQTLKSLRLPETQQKLKKYFQTGENTTFSTLDSGVELHFVKIYRNSGVSIRNGDTQVSFTEFTSQKLDALHYAIEFYRGELEEALDAVRTATQKVEKIFDQFYYASVQDFKIVRKIFKTSAFNPQNIIELELIFCFYKKFLEAVEEEKKEETILDDVV